jgi:hypothetical protein
LGAYNQDESSVEGSVRGEGILQRLSTRLEANGGTAGALLFDGMCHEMTRTASGTKLTAPKVGRFISYLSQVLLGTGPGSNGAAPAMNVHVRCGRCGELITVRVDKANDLLCEYPDIPEDAEEAPHPIGYELHKEVVGRKCPQLVHFEMRFDDHRRVTKTKIEGGEIVEWEDTR